MESLAILFMLIGLFLAAFGLGVYLALSRKQKEINLYKDLAFAAEQCFKWDGDGYTISTDPKDFKRYKKMKSRFWEYQFKNIKVPYWKKITHHNLEQGGIVTNAPKTEGGEFVK